MRVIFFHDVATRVYLTTYFDEINQNTSFSQLIYDRYRIFYMNGKQHYIDFINVNAILL